MAPEMVVSGSRKYWKMIFEKLQSDGWSVGMLRCVQEGLSIWIADASKDGKRHITRAEEITAAFLELERSCES